MNEAWIARVLDALVPPLGDLPGGSCTLPALLADSAATAVLGRLDATPRTEDADPLARWQQFAAAEPGGAALVLHLLCGAYFADRRVRDHYVPQPGRRPEPARERLADLLDTVPHAPGLPYRAPHPRTKP